MSVSNRRRRWRRDAAVLVVALAVRAFVPFTAMAQGHDEGHAHNDHDDHDGPLHFSHPIFTESPSPDTKLRLDYLFRQITSDAREHSVRLEAEYAFTPNVSIEANIPVTSRSESGTTANSVGSGEFALKLASFAQAERGLLLGGGLAVGVPTGNDHKGIGSGHIFEIEPYVDAGFKRGEVEFVSFLSYSVAVNKRPGDPDEKAFALAVSGLYHVAERIESLIEFQTTRPVSGEESGHQAASIGLGLKYHVGRVHHLVLGLGGRVPITRERESEREVLLSALWHF